MSLGKKNNPKPLTVNSLKKEKKKNIYLNEGKKSTNLAYESMLAAWSLLAKLSLYSAAGNYQYLTAPNKTKTHSMNQELLL